MAMKKTTGPDVSGKATIQPLTACPHFRPATLAPPIRTGVRINFKMKVLSIIFQRIHSHARASSHELNLENAIDSFARFDASHISHKIISGAASRP